MADNQNEKQDDDVVDEREGKVLLSARFMWISVSTWIGIVGTLPKELWPAVHEFCWIDGNCVVIPRVTWLLIRALASVQPLRH